MKKRKKLGREISNNNWKAFLGCLIGCLVILLMTASFVLAEDDEATVCCEKTTYGAYCQNELPENCDAGYSQTPTSCEATSFCKKGCCYDEDEGLCMENTPELVCDNSGGTYFDSDDCSVEQCSLSCCVLGDQAAFVSLARCKKLAGFYGLNTNWRTDVEDELSCIALAQSQDQGACVYETDYTKTCQFTTRAECTEDAISEILDEEIVLGFTNSTLTFYKDKLCTAPELGTNCARTDETTCVEGKDEVYFVDSCGNPANVYDSSKINNEDYWTEIVSKEESCGYGSDNAGSSSCGNCDYFLGSMCQEEGTFGGASYGDYICTDLDCDNDKQHGETWCEYDGEDELFDAVGARHYRKLCYMGEIMTEPCSDFKQEICLEDVIETTEGDFEQGGCIVNRWEDCTSQEDEDECEDTDERDCKWVDQTKEKWARCVPDFSPGLEFWDESSEDVCSAGNVVCVITYEVNDITGDKDCIDNCECEGGSWKEHHQEVCSSLGDCGADYNYIGTYSDEGFEIETKSGDTTGSVIQGWITKAYEQITGG